jgi:hypothetical protein
MNGAACNIKKNPNPQRRVFAENSSFDASSRLGVKRNNAADLCIPRSSARFPMSLRVFIGNVKPRNVRSHLPSRFGEREKAPQEQGGRLAGSSSLRGRVPGGFALFARMEAAVEIAQAAAADVGIDLGGADAGVAQ